MKNLLWDLFKKTGDYKYYLFFKELEKDSSYENRKNRGNNNKWCKF